MHNPDDIAADLPAPRDDEPDSLRRDTVDELRDHLHSALHRERVKCADDRRALSQVLAQFGDPAGIATRLWWDAMWERVMSQRMMLAASVVMALACGAMFVLAWQGFRTQQDFFARQQQHAETLIAQFRDDADAAARQRQEQFETLLAQSQDLNRELAAQAKSSADLAQQSLAEGRAAREQLVGRLAAIEQRPDEPSDWNPVELKLVQGTGDGPPAVGFTARMTISSQETGIPPMSAISDATGTARIERVRYGTYSLRVSAPWGEHSSRNVSIQPGEGYAATIVCPPAEPEELAVAVSVAWPEDLAQRAIFTAFSQPHAFREFSGMTWSRRGGMQTNARGGSGGRSSRSFGSSSATSLRTAPSGVIYFSSPFGGRFGGTDGFENLPARALDSLLTNVLVESTNPDGPSMLMRWPGADYRPMEVEFHVPANLADHTAFGRGEGLAPDAPMAWIEPATIREDDVQVRIEDGVPARLVLIPGAQAETAMRDVFAKLDEAIATGLENGRGFSWSQLAGRPVSTRDALGVPVTVGTAKP